MLWGQYVGSIGLLVAELFNCVCWLVTGKYKDLNETKDAIHASGAIIVTVAIRRTNIGQNKDEPNLLDVILNTPFCQIPQGA